LKFEVLKRIGRLVRDKFRGPQDIADDLEQESVERYVKAERSGTPRNPDGLAKTIVDCVYVDHIRGEIAERQRAAEREKFAAAEANASESDTDNESEISVLHAQLHQAIDELPPDERRVIRALLLENLSIRDAAVALEIPVSTAERHMSNAYRSLRARLGAPQLKEDRS
jgi:RNA polymerase sigma factor (sigma-70 family)